MSLLAPGRNIVLIGLMGAGKSTVGRRVAGRLQRPFIDTDAMVAKAAGTSVAEVFETHGEREFRRLEAAAVRRVAALRGQVIAVGGGAVLDPANSTQLRATGDLVLLDGEPEALAARIRDTASRPLLQGESPARRLAELRRERGAVYAAAATTTIDTTGHSLAEVADAVVEWARTQPGLLSRDEADA